MWGKHRQENKLVMADTVRERLGSLLVLRVPWLLVGLAGGLATSVVVSRFETTIADNIALTFFLPVIVYMSDAVGTQTEAIFIRRLALGKVRFWRYLLKEIVVGVVAGVVLGVGLGAVAGVWTGRAEVAWVVGLAMGVSVSLAPVVAMMIPEFLFREHIDPAVGSGPFVTIVQDLASVAIYLSIAGWILG